MAEVFYFSQGASIPDFTNRVPAMARVDLQVNYAATGQTWPGLAQGDNYAVRWTGQVIITVSGQYEFWTTSDDGSRLTIDGTKVVDNDGLHGMQTRSGKIVLSAGMHALLLEFFEKAGGAGMMLKYQGPDTDGQTVVVPTNALWHGDVGPTPAPTPAPATTTTTTSTATTTTVPGAGLMAEVFYFSQGASIPDFTNRVPAMARVDLQVNYAATGQTWPGLAQGDNYAVRWTGQVIITVSGQYEFWTTSDDGSRLTIDGTKVVDNDGLHGMQTRSGKIVLSAGMHALLLEFFEKAGGAGMMLKYQGPDTDSQTVVVPTNALWHGEVATATTTTTTTIATTTITVATSTTTTTTTSSTTFDDSQLTAYWDYQSCGPKGDNYNWEWCGANFQCKPIVEVATSTCASGLASLAETSTFITKDGCQYAYFAQYICHTNKAAVPGLLVEVFYFSQGGSLLDLTAREPALVRTDPQPYESTHGNWPGLPLNDNFAVRWTGQVAITTAGEYTFLTNSDDCRVLIDGLEVVDNDGLHGMQTRSGTIMLSARMHDLLVEFLEKDGGAGMIFKYQGPDTGGQMVVVPESVLSHIEKPGRRLSSDTHDVPSKMAPVASQAMLAQGMLLV